MGACSSRGHRTATRVQHSTTRQAVGGCDLVGEPNVLSEQVRDPGVILDGGNGIDVGGAILGDFRDVDGYLTTRFV